MNYYKRHKGIILILVFAFIAKAYFFIMRAPWTDNMSKFLILNADPSQYHNLALAFLKSNSIDAFGIFRTLGYPFFLSIIYYLFGAKIWVVLLFQELISICTGIVVYKLALEILNKISDVGTTYAERINKIALLATALFLIDPVYNDYTLRILTDSLFVTFLSISFLFFIKGMNTNVQSSKFKVQSLRLLIVSSIALGIATLIRPIAQFYPLIIVIIVFSRKSLVFSISNKFKYSLIYLFVYLLTLSPFLFHNLKRYDYFSLTTVDGMNLLFYNATYSEVNRTGKTFKDVRMEFYKEYQTILNSKFYILNSKFKIQNSKFNSIDTNTDLTEDSLLIIDYVTLPNHIYKKHDKDNPFYKSAVQKKIAINYIKNNFIDYCKIQIKGMLDIHYQTSAQGFASLLGFKKEKKRFQFKTLPTGYSELKQRLNTRSAPVFIITIIIGVYFLFIYTGFLLGCYKLLKTKEYIILIFILLTVIYFITLSGPQGEGRFRLPVLPFYLIIGVKGISDLLSRIKDSRLNSRLKIKN